MLTLTKRAEYALIAAVHLARMAPQGVVSARELADRYHISKHLLNNVLKDMARGGLVESLRGVRGGYRLAITPSELSLGMLVETVERPVRLTACSDQADANGDHGDSDCCLMGVCPIAGPMRKVHTLLTRFFDRIKVSDIALDSCEQSLGRSIEADPVLKVLAQ